MLSRQLPLMASLVIAYSLVLNNKLYHVSVLYDASIGIGCLNDDVQFNKCGLLGCAKINLHNNYCGANS